MERYYASDIQEFWNRHGFTSVMAITSSAAIPILKTVSQRLSKSSLRYTVSVWVASDSKSMPEDLSVFEMPVSTDPAYYAFPQSRTGGDGENDCRTGYMYEPYVGHFDTDPPGNRGTLVTPPALVDQFVAIAGKAGKISMLHCSGDAATDIALDAYDKTGPSKLLCSSA